MLIFELALEAMPSPRCGLACFDNLKAPLAGIISRDAFPTLAAAATYRDCLRRHYPRAHICRDMGAECLLLRRYLRYLGFHFRLGLRL